MYNVGVFSKCYKTQMLQSIINDPNYCSDNAFDIFYKQVTTTSSITSSDSIQMKSGQYWNPLDTLEIHNKHMLCIQLQIIYPNLINILPIIYIV